jgi:integrase
LEKPPKTHQIASMAQPSTSTGVRVITLKDGKCSYEARVHRRGAGSLTKTFRTAAEASTWKGNIDALIDAGIDPATLAKKKVRIRSTGAAPALEEAESPRAQLTVGQAIQNYINHRQQSHNALPANYRTDYDRVRDDWGDVLVVDLRNEDISNYITLLLKTPTKRDAKRLKNDQLDSEPRTYAKATVRKFIYAMKIALEWQAKNNKVRLNEFLFDFDKKVMPGSWEGQRDRRLLPGEEEKLYEAGITRGDITYTEDDWRALIGFALETAMRQQEIALAKFSHVSPDGYKLRIPASHTKTKKARTILLSRRAREIVELQRKRQPKARGRIFHQFAGAAAISQSFARLTARASIDDLHFHDLRHEATSRLCESGKLSQMAIMEMTAHASLHTFRGYVHLISHENSLRLE